MPCLSKPALGHMSLEQQVSMQAVLIPSVTVGGGDSMPGCFTHEGGVTITKGQLFLWEMIMTFVLVSTVYAVAVTKPGHGNIGPLAVGFSLFASAFIGEPSGICCTAAIPPEACLTTCASWDLPGMCLQKAQINSMVHLLCS